MTLEEIRQNMTTDVVLIFRNNHFLGQDILDAENKIAALTGFDGSAGTLAVTRGHAFLFVDGRYEIQSKRQTNADEITVIVENGEKNLYSWLKENFAAAAVGFNPWQISEKQLQKLKSLLPKAVFRPCPQIAATARATAFEHSEIYAGESAAKKIDHLTRIVRVSGCDAFFFAAADSVSWLTNLRSNALPDTPVVRAMALLTKEGKLTLFADNLRLPSGCPFEKMPFSKIKKVLKTFAGCRIGFDFNTTPAALVAMCFRFGIEAVQNADSCAFFKAQKNDTELRGMINAHIRDGEAVCRFLAWFEKNRQGKNENDIVRKILAFRKKQKLFYSVSFGTIAGAGANAAVIHYQPPKDKGALLEENSVLLLDSGGQYLDGTTDITRTIAVGTPSGEMKEKFTIVLKAHIALASLRFPHNTSGTRLDAVCRSVMWRHGLDYNHGTGHGVGCFLNVHEGPQNMGASGNTYPLKAGMVMSVEPGYYRENAFGIRIENLVYVAEDETAPGFLKFVPLTMVPVDFRLINEYLLTDGERKWLNDYHRTVRETISPRLSGKEKLWLEKACAPL